MAIFMCEEVFHRDGGVLDEGLFHQTILLKELFQFAFDDLRPCGRGLAHLLGLPLIDRPFFVDDDLGMSSRFYVGGFGGGDLQGKIVDECL